MTSHDVCNVQQESDNEASCHPQKEGCAHVSVIQLAKHDGIWATGCRQGMRHVDCAIVIVQPLRSWAVPTSASPVHAACHI